MWKNRILLLASFLCLLGNARISMAAFSIDELVSATTKALELFKKDNAAHLQHFTGYKAWISGEESKVKVYVNHDGMAMDFNYLCHKHDDGIECHAQ